MINTKALPYQIAAIDLDGTLLNEFHKISDANLKALRRLEQAGITIVLASGRTHDSVMNYQAYLKLSGPVLSNHGALVKHSHSDEIISFNPLTAKAARETVAEAKKRNATVIYCQLGGAFACQKNEWTELFEQRAGYKLKFIESFDTLHDGHPYKIIWMDKPEVLSKIHKTLKADFARKYYVARGDAEHLEFLCPKANKANGLKAIAKHFNVTNKSVISFGDADNDISMLEWAGLGVAMNHATEGAKFAANIIAPPGPNETSFARAVEAVFDLANQ